ncbi:vomeronasal type-1 receptor 1-like [Petaurus breviceps papuanus]|uniref:vomeronasal type-1 receptor 1-like n=1 Tax=Petaurus breviceps papuanus TaxID=3040969 RepID=UPI0036DB6E5A
MISNEIALGLLFLFQTGFGVLGNSFLMGLYIVTFFTGSRLRPIDLLLSHLAFVNDLVLLFKGIPQIMTTLGLTNFLDDVGCKLVFYCHKVARDLSLCTTCLLSSFQAITLSPRSSWLAKLKARALKCIVPLFLLCWTFYLLTNYTILLYVKGPQGNKNTTEGQAFFYCVATFPVSHNIAIHILTVSLPDVLCMGIMVRTSGYMVFVLYRHHQRAKYIHGNSLTPSGSLEIRATQTILLLVILFVSFYSLNSILILCIPYAKSSWVVYTSAFLSTCFPTCSSFILIFSDSQVGKYVLTLWEKMMIQF